MEENLDTGAVGQTDGIAADNLAGPLEAILRVNAGDVSIGKIDAV